MNEDAVAIIKQARPVNLGASYPNFHVLELLSRLPDRDKHERLTVVSDGQREVSCDWTLPVVDIEGNYSPASTAELAVTITGAGVFDVLNVTGTAALNGSLVPTVTGFTPTSGEAFQVLASGGLNGSTFSAVTGPFTAQYTTNDASAIAN